MLNFAYRNLILFFKDKTAVILSFLAEFIIIGLYLLFMRDNLINNFSQIKNSDLLMDVWMISGILGITSLSTTMGAYGIMIEDKVKKIDRDFCISPLRKFTFSGGYMISAIIIGFSMTFLLFVFSIVFILIHYGVKLGANHVFIIYGTLFLTSFSNASLTLLLVSFLRSNLALASCCTIVGALIGFLTGIYIPMGSLPESVQLFIKCFPISHGVVLFRQILMEPLLIESFNGIKNASAQQFIEYMGIQYYDGTALITKADSVCFLVAAAVICLVGIAAREYTFL